MKTLSVTLLTLGIAATTYAQQPHLQGFHQTTDCAALIAVFSQKQLGEITPKHANFNKIAYTLGKAENHRQDGKIAANTQQTYQQKVLALFSSWEQQSPKQKKAQKRQYQQCLNDAALYDPKTQIPALIEKAKQQAQP